MVESLNPSASRSGRHAPMAVTEEMEATGIVVLVALLNSCVGKLVSRQTNNTELLQMITNHDGVCVRRGYVYVMQHVPRRRSLRDRAGDVRRGGVDGGELLVVWTERNWFGDC